ncbi:hypothetical protein TCON_2765, partial [Astathelohania contejeani]
NRDQFYAFIVNNVEGGDNNRSIRDITDPYTYYKLIPQSTLPQFEERQKLTIVTLYSLRIRMGSIGGQPRVFQIHFTFRAIINQDQDHDHGHTVWVEYVLNYDRVEGIYNGYRFYTQRPQLFINMIETHESYEESQALSNMMADDGIVFRKDKKKLLELTDWIYLNQNLMTSYVNCNLFFFYLLNRTVQWQSTPNYTIFKKWWKKTKRDDNHYHFLPKANGDDIFQLEEFISLRPKPTKYFAAIKILAEIENYVSQSNVRILTDVGSDTFSKTDLTNIKQIKRVYHLEDEIENYVSRSDIRILADVGLDTFSKADFNIKQIDRVYHEFVVSWITGTVPRNFVLQYELMVRMQRIKQKPVYMELIINFEDVINGSGYMPKEGILLVTADPHLYCQTFLTGNKQKINNFIRKDEGLPLSSSEESLNLKCAEKVLDQFIQSGEVYMLDTWAWVCGERRIMLPQYW